MTTELFKCDFFVPVIFGEDVAFGGVFRCTVGLKDKYGEQYLRRVGCIVIIRTQVLLM